MRSVRRTVQRGAAAVLSVLFLLFMLGVVLVIAHQMATTEVHDSGAQNLSVSALYLAESAVERATWRYSNGTACGAGLAETITNPFGGGANTSFAILNSPLPSLVGGRCRLSARGSIGDVARTIVVDLQPGGSALFSEHFSNLTGWTEVLTNNQGTSSFDGATNCPASVCSATVGGTGSLLARTFGWNQRLRGYRERTLPTAITTGTGLSVTTFLGYAKHSGNNPRRSVIGVVLRDTAANITTSIWVDPTANVQLTCTPTPPPLPDSCWLNSTQIVALPAGRTYNRIRITFDLQQRGNNRVSAWFDALAITGGGGSAAVVRWTE